MATATLDRPPNDPARTDPATRRVMDALRRIVRGLSGSARVLPGGSKVSGAQLFVLRQIGAAPGLTIGALASRTLAGQSTVSEVVAKLVARRLVARQAGAEDARQSVLTLTAAGRRAVADVAPTAQERLGAGLQALRPAERRALADALDAWLDRAGLGHVPATMFLEEGAPARRTKATRLRPGRRP